MSLSWVLPAQAADVPFAEHVVSTTAGSPQSVLAIDVNGDGHIDIVSGSRDEGKIAWYQSDGGSPPMFTEHVISTTADNTLSVFATDVDGDGDVDVLSASFNRIAWHENDGGLLPTFTERALSTSPSSAGSVFATDVDGDGDTDILSAINVSDQIAWYENDGGSPPTFTQRVISTTALRARSVFATDLDGDGDTDVLSASRGDDKIAWYENNGASPPTFTERVISTTAVFAVSVFATDVDGDGNTDVLSAGIGGGQLVWYQSDGASPPSFAEHVISVAPSSQVFATDVDGDGDTDVVSASGGSGKVEWYESDGGSPPSFTKRLILTTATGANSVFARDIDGDGDTDVLAAFFFEDKIAWYENTSPLCGNGTANPGEECDSGIGCTACVCDAGFEPTVPPSLTCQPVCGDGTFASGEECDGGLGCMSCLCDAGFEPTVPPSLDCQAICGNGALDPGERCDGGLGCTDCACDPSFEPTVPASLGCRPICGNGVCGTGEDSCNCPVDCGTPPSNEAFGGTCSDGIDNDCDGFTDSDDSDCAAVPTVSEWGLIAMSLLLLAGAKVYFNRRRALG